MRILATWLLLATPTSVTGFAAHSSPISINGATSKLNAHGGIESGVNSLTPSFESSKYLQGAAAAALFLAPLSNFEGLMLANKWAGSAGYLAAAGISHTLAVDAAENTFEDNERLRRSLLWFGTLGLLSFPGEAALVNYSAARVLTFAILTAAKVVSVLSVLPNIKWSKPGWEPMLHHLRSVRKGMTLDASNLKGRTYRNIGILLCGGVLCTFMEGLFNFRVSCYSR